MVNNDILDVLYFKCLSYSLTGNIEKTKMYFELIEGCMDKEEDKKILLKYLNQYKLNELKRIRREIEIGKPIQEFEPITPIEENIEPTEHDLKLEKQLVKLSYYSLEKLNKFLGEELVGKGIERETYHTGGKCDMVLQNNERTIFPIEFKLNQATHAVVSQIDKYCMHFKLELIYKLYDNVQGVVIASSFSKYAINALLKRGIICLQYTCKNDIVSYKQIKKPH
jgi:hypothetical protein